MNDNRTRYSQLIKIVTIILITAFLGELKVITFSSSFRFGLGSAAFFFLLLFYKDVSYLFIGLISGIFITFFRIGLDFMLADTFQFKASFFIHSPIIGYYFIFAALLYLGRSRMFYDSPFYLGVLGAFSDGIANIVELFIRSQLAGDFLLTAANLEYVIIIAILRSFFVVGLFNMIHSQHMKGIYQEQRRRFEQIQLITSGLYVEVFYLKKLLLEIEDVTAKSFDLYQQLKQNDRIPQEISSTALAVAQEVHEVKKDNQRVLAGLEKIIDQESLLINMSLLEVIQLIIRANQKYASMLKKKIEFRQLVQSNIQLKEIYSLVAILNNLVSNAVEAIDNEGYIEVTVIENNQHIEIQIIDNGVGIQSGDEEIIFEPGFTTKFDETGKSSTGIGLSHVKSMVHNLDGSIDAYSDSLRTIFKIVLPIDSLKGRE